VSVVLHVARTDLDGVGDLGELVEAAEVGELADHGHPGHRLDLTKDVEAAQAESLEALRRRAGLEGARAQDGGPGGLHGESRLHGHLVRLDRTGAGDRGEVRATDGDVADVDDLAQGVGLHDTGARRDAGAHRWSGHHVPLLDWDVLLP
jgi:hypothetical protein